MSPLVNICAKDRKRMGTESPYTWYTLLDENEIRHSVDVLGRFANDSRSLVG